MYSISAQLEVERIWDFSEMASSTLITYILLDIGKVSNYT